MPLIQVDVEQFRCIERARLTLHPQVNLIVGQNASGKTSLLEAIFLLGTGRSFRTHQTELLIQTGRPQFVVVGKLEGPQGLEVVGIKGTADGKEIRVNGSPAKSLIDLAVRLPVQVIDPEVHRLIEDGPVGRRRFMDWGVFHVEPTFHDTWRRYHRALRQRNAGLKAKHSAMALRIWDEELAEQGTRIANFRDQYISALTPFVNRLSQELLGAEITLEHQRGWRRQAELAAALTGTLQRDQARGTTGAGPHRADLMLKMGDIAARDLVSRGQQKMLACVLILAQQIHRVANGSSPACLLLDDPAAELDAENLRKLLNVVAQVPAQLVVTTLAERFKEFLPPGHEFHVEHGCVRAVA